MSYIEGSFNSQGDAIFTEEICERNLGFPIGESEARISGVNNVEDKLIEQLEEKGTTKVVKGMIDPEEYRDYYGV